MSQRNDAAAAVGAAEPPAPPAATAAATAAAEPSAATEVQGGSHYEDVAANYEVHGSTAGCVA